ncbi:hypothetical protein SCHAM137S_01979 [Streptomyces chartreusis]
MTPGVCMRCSRQGIAKTEQILGPIKIPVHAQLHLQVSRAVVTESRHITGELRHEVHLPGIQQQCRRYA